MTNQTPFDRAIQQQDALFNEMLRQVHWIRPDDYTVLRSNGKIETKSVWISEDMRAKNLPLGSLAKVGEDMR